MAKDDLYTVMITETVVYSREATVEELEDITDTSVSDYGGDVAEMVQASFEQNSEMWEWLERWSDVVSAEIEVRKLVTS